MSAGEPGTGKRVALRLIVRRLARTEGLRVAVLADPCSILGSVYREMGGRLGIELMPGNRSGGLLDVEDWQVDGGPGLQEHRQQSGAAGIPAQFESNCGRM